MLKIICLKNIKNDKCEFFKSIETLFENYPDIRYYNSNFEGSASIEWIKAEIVQNGVASIHTVKPAQVFCGLEFPEEITEFVVSYIDVK